MCLLAPPLFHASFAAHSPLTHTCSRRRSRASSLPCPFCRSLPTHTRLLAPPLAVPAPPPPLTAVGFVQSILAGKPEVLPHLTYF